MAYKFTKSKCARFATNFYFVDEISCEQRGSQWECAMIPDWIDAEVKCRRNQCVLHLESHLIKYCIILALVIIAMAFVVKIIERQMEAIFNYKIR